MMIQPISGDNSTGSNNNQINNAFRQLNREQEIKTFKQANGNVGLASGILPNNAGYGELLYDSSGLARIGMRIVNNQPELKVAKAGFDVTTAADANLIFNSNQNVFKIVSKLSITFPAIPNTGTGSANLYQSVTSNNSIPHGLGYTPAYVAFIVIGTQYYQLPSISNAFVNGFTGTARAGAIWTTYQISVDSQNVYPETDLLIYNSAGASATALNGVVYLLQETAN